jgi:hypothetical protein
MHLGKVTHNGPSVISSSSFCIVLLLGLLLRYARANAQQIVTTELRDAPNPRQSISSPGASAPSEHTDPQTKRILDIFPNFRAVSAQTHLPPQPVQEKFVTASEDSFDYSAFVLPAVLAAEAEAANDTPEFGHGGVGYSRYLWHTYLDQTSENYCVEFITPTLTREDSRYYTLGPGSGRALKRVGYSMSRVVITRNDAGHDTFNLSEVVGAGTAAAISNLYYPRADRTLSNTTDKWAINVGVDAAGFLAREFWPDINYFLFHGKQPMESH